MNFIRRFTMAAAAFFSILTGSGSEQVIRLLASYEPPAGSPNTEKPDDGKPDAAAGTTARASVQEGADALHLLAIFQREGRLVDFLQEDISGFSDEQVGAAVRSVHSGCRKVLAECIPLKPVIGKDEGSTVTVSAEDAGKNVTLTGSLAGQGPFKGILCHRGWKAEAVVLPKISAGRDLSVIAPAEVEI